MELVRCPNCTSVYGDVQDTCPSCGADREGEGAEHELDVTARSAVVRLGGVLGGLLEGPAGTVLVWCERGVCLVDEEIGLVWRADMRARVDGVSFDERTVRVETGRERIVLRMEDGARL